MSYTVEKNVQILISLLKQYHIRKVIASPGTKNISFIGSIQKDPDFELYSAPDERSAAYMACGMAAESGECVCLSCTGATASRNYISGLTEAYYRKLPVIAITSTVPSCYIGHNMDQVIDRRAQLNDMTVFSAQIPIVRCDLDQWACEIAVNRALIAAGRNGGGPVHLNVETEIDRDFSAKELMKARKIDWYSYDDEDRFPRLNEHRIGIFVGNHGVMSEELQNEITRFCEIHDAVVFCDQTSNYFGPYRVVPSIVMKQDHYRTKLLDLDLLIHIGNTSGSQFRFHAAEVWRVNPDGEIRDTFLKLKAVFAVSELFFFRHYAEGTEGAEKKHACLDEWNRELDHFYSLLPELPFSNLYAAKEMIRRIPEGSTIHLGILNSLRSWDYFDHEIHCNAFCNTGGFGIDGILSSLIGSAIVRPDSIHFGVIGDLAFFYDMNSLGNRHVPNNIRILLINNGRGVEFRKYSHPGYAFGDDADLYMAAGGHYGRQSPELVKHYVQDLGFLYLSASDKEQFHANLERFVDPSESEQPIVFELFVDYHNDNDALKLMNNLERNNSRDAKSFARNLVGKEGIRLLKKVLDR